MAVKLRLDSGEGLQFVPPNRFSNFMSQFLSFPSAPGDGQSTSERPAFARPIPKGATGIPHKWAEAARAITVSENHPVLTYGRAGV